MSMALNANINDMAQHLRNMQDKLDQLENNVKSNTSDTSESEEFDIYLSSGMLHLYIFKQVVEARGWELTINNAGWKIRKGEELEINKENPQKRYKLNLEFSTSGNFEIRCNDAGKPTQDAVDYFVFMNLKYIIFVKAEDVIIDKPKVKQGDGYKYYNLNLKNSKIKSKQIIQYSEVVI